MNDNRIKWLEEQIDNHNDIIQGILSANDESVKHHQEKIRKYHVELITLKFS
mgnify:CR=1 FL=1|tara:strand:+ start:3258 stop:3413 length:156 start_codon:yes stop_codon:yes gene_type:complete